MRYLHLSSGAPIPVLGLGTWHMGEASSRGADVVNALRLGIDLGMTLIDTAEMYGEGGAEEVVAKAIAGQRSQVFLVSKVYPHNATRQGVVAACERSLKRLNTDHLDLYLLHWIGNVPFQETLAGFDDLQRAGKIREHGVSNFDSDDMTQWTKLPGGKSVATNQVMYNLSRRGIEWELLPWCRKRHIPIMAYSPVDQGSLLTKRGLKQIAVRRGVTPAQVALAWLLHQEGVVAIPKAARPDHVRENRAALDLELTPDELKELDRAFPPPIGPKALQMV
ncbi:MAG TPA: aldo/keto reductase [Stellaceae bacterium]|jgi:diketogulonate reductase-like aldo/keto reductase|nr:aldo/keto reductase [Stellaceae bacterium]